MGIKLSWRPGNILGELLPASAIVYLEVYNNFITSL